MVATTLIKSMDRDLLVRQLKEGCRAKQYAFARKILGYLILQDKMRGKLEHITNVNIIQCPVLLLRLKSKSV